MPAQLIANTLVAASGYATVGIGFALIYRFAKFFHFAHAGVITLGAYACLFFLHRGIPLPLAAVTGIAFTAAVGMMLERCMYRPLKDQANASLSLTLASLGLLIACENAIALGFGSDAQALRPGAVVQGTLIAGARMTSAQAAIVFVGIGVAIATWALLVHSSIGRQIRSASIDPELATVIGINGHKVGLYAFGCGSALAGLAGILLALDVDMVPSMGLDALMSGVIAAVIGGGSVAATGLGAALLAGAQQLGAWTFGAGWQDPIAFAILVVFLMARPRGVLETMGHK